MVWAFVPVAILVTLTPGASAAMIVRSSIRGGWHAGLRTIAGNEIGVLSWALLSVLGVSALIAASDVAFVVLRVVGAAVLVWLGATSLLRARRSGQGASVPATLPGMLRPRAFRDGVITSLANPKLAIFFVALFPQFIHDRGTVLQTTLAMATLIVVFDLMWYSAVSYAVARAKVAVTRTRLARWMERVSGTILIALGIRVALEQR